MRNVSLQCRSVAPGNEHHTILDLTIKKCNCKHMKRWVTVTSMQPYSHWPRGCIHECAFDSFYRQATGTQTCLFPRKLATKLPNLKTNIDFIIRNCQCILRIHHSPHFLCISYDIRLQYFFSYKKIKKNLFKKVINFISKNHSKDYL